MAASAGLEAAQQPGYYLDPRTGEALHLGDAWREEHEHTTDDDKED